MADAEKLALQGGEKAVKTDPGNMFTWPIITSEDEDAVQDVIRKGKMSGTDVTQEYEKEFAAWQGSKYALGCSSGTASIHSAMWACGVGRGTEIICPSLTFWASALQALNLGAAIHPGLRCSRRRRFAGMPFRRLEYPC